MSSACFDITATGYMSWLPIVVLLFVIVYLILAIFYMLSKVFSRPDWEGRVKVELMRMVVSSLFIFGIAAFLDVTCEISNAMTGGEDPFKTSRDFLARFVFSSVRTDSIPANLNLMWDKARESRIGATLVTPAPSCVSGVCYNERGGAIYIANNMEMLTSVIMPFSTALVVQMLALDVIKMFALTIVLPAGFIMKILPVTRDSGAYLISMALAFYFVFPMVYVMGSMIHKSIGKSVINTLESQVSSAHLGDAFDDGGESLKALARLGYITPYAVTIPLLAVILTLAAARSLFPIFSKDFIGEVPM